MPAADWNGKAGGENEAMRTTIEISDELLRKARAQAAAEGVRLHDLGG